MGFIRNFLVKSKIGNYGRAHLYLSRRLPSFASGAAKKGAIDIKGKLVDGVCNLKTGCVESRPSGCGQGPLSLLQGVRG